MFRNSLRSPELLSGYAHEAFDFVENCARNPEEMFLKLSPGACSGIFHDSGLEDPTSVLQSPGFIKGFLKFEQAGSPGFPDPGSRQEHFKPPDPKYS